MKKLKYNLYFIRRLVVAVYSLFIAGCVTYVMTSVYDPEINSVKALASVYMDVICVIILLVLLCSITFDYHGSNKTTKLFAGMLFASIWAVFMDLLNWAFDGMLEFGKLTFWFTVGSLCMGSVLAGVLILYLRSYLDETHGITHLKIQTVVCVVMNVCSFIGTFILAITGTAFEYVDGHYNVGALYDIVTVVPVLTLLFFTGVIVFNSKKIGIHDVFAVVGYITFMIAGALIEAANGVGTTYVSVAIADIFIFVMLQNQIIIQEKQNVKTWMYRSNTDQLTGLYNRRAYETDVKELNAGIIDEDFVYISIDVNSLKAVNDTLGHNAGDELLIGTSECIKKCFGAYGKLYRIGGDEFIGLINADENNLTKLQSEIKELTECWSGDIVKSLSISCGYAKKSEFDEGTSIKEMAAVADKRMYEAKREYYRTK